MRITIDDKRKIYELKKKNKTWMEVARIYKIDYTYVYYLYRLFDRYGIDILDRNYTRYDEDFKKESVKRILFNKEKISDVSVDIGLPNSQTLHRWIKEYKNEILQEVKEC